MKITFTPRGIVWAVWIKALFHEVCPETVNIRNVKNQPPPLDTSIAVFEVQNRIPVFWLNSNKGTKSDMETTRRGETWRASVRVF